MSTNNNFIHSDRCGVTVVGSSVIRVSPDSVSIVAAVSRMEAEPKEAFSNARAAANAVEEFLKSEGIRSFSSSRITLAQEIRLGHGDMRNPAMGYKARIGFNIKLTDLDRVGELVSGLIAAGANELAAVNYQTSLLKETRNDARREAIAAAKEKAELYSHEAALTIGRVLAINEVIMNAPPPKPPSAATLTDPAEISVAANVEMTFEIVRDGLE
jgi:uncharacterized protein